MDYRNIFHPLREIRTKYYRSLYKSERFPIILQNDRKRAFNILWNSIYKRDFPWEHPATLNEKISWMSALTDTSTWSQLTDKYSVRKYVEGLGLSDILPQCFGIWNCVSDINYDFLPSSFVLKCTHDCASAIVIKDKRFINEEEINKKLSDHIATVYGYKSCEPHYTTIIPRIMAEELLADNSTFSSSLVDYKFFCINGHVECCMVCYDRKIEEGKATKDLYNVHPWKKMTWETSAFNQRQTNRKDVPCPPNLEVLISIAEQLSKGFPFVRVDLYDIMDEKPKVVFGEMTFTPHGGRLNCFSDEYQHVLGDKLNIPM